MLMQPVEPTRRTYEPVAPRMQPAEFAVRQAAVPFRDQALHANINLFMDREEERNARSKPFVMLVEQLAGSIGGSSQQGLPPPPPPPPPPPQLSPQEVAAEQQVTPPPTDDRAAVVAPEAQPAASEQSTDDVPMSDASEASGAMGQVEQDKDKEMDTGQS